MFGLPVEKEIMPYSIFTKDFINDGNFLIEPSEIARHYSDQMVSEMTPNIIKHGCVCEQDGKLKWDMLKYSIYYCQQDCRLLSLGWSKFRSMTLDCFDLDINACETLTVASLAFKHLQKSVFDGTFSVSGIVLEFIRQATFGGQVGYARNSMIGGGRLCQLGMNP